MVMVSPSISMMFGCLSEPAYHLTITTLHSDIAPTKNKQSIFLLQAFMLNTLNIRPTRGLFALKGVAEDNLGVTIQQEIENMEQNQSNEDTGVLRTISRQRSRKGKAKTTPIITDHEKNPMPPNKQSHVQINSRASEDTVLSEGKETERKRVKKKRSIMSFFRRTEQSYD
jgi:hypothetical protein